LNAGPHTCNGRDGTSHELKQRRRKSSDVSWVLEHGRDDRRRERANDHQRCRHSGHHENSGSARGFDTFDTLAGPARSPEAVTPLIQQLARAALGVTATHPRR
jgi:hypothetical protein